MHSTERNLKTPHTHTKKTTRFMTGWIWDVASNFRMTSGDGSSRLPCALGCPGPLQAPGLDSIWLCRKNSTYLRMFDLPAKPSHAKPSLGQGIGPDRLGALGPLGPRSPATRSSVDTPSGAVGELNLRSRAFPVLRRRKAFGPRRGRSDDRRAPSLFQVSQTLCPAHNGGSFKKLQT